MAETYKPLAGWKVWWGYDLVEKVAMCLKEHIKRLPGQGKLLSQASFAAVDMQDDNVACVAEALLLSYPADKQPSAYMLGDSVLVLDSLWSHALLGKPQENPCREKVRRDDALSQGMQLKKLLSYVRTIARRAELGRTDTVTYLKGLANKREVKARGSPASSSRSSPSPLLARQLPGHLLI